MSLFIFVLTSFKAAVNPHPLRNKLVEEDYTRLIKCLEIIETQIELNTYNSIYEIFVSRDNYENRPAKKFQYYANEYAIWSNNKLDLIFFVVLNGINIITEWSSIKEKLKHKNICEYEKDTMTEIVIGKNKRKVQIIQIQKFTCLLSPFSLCDPDHESYIGNYFENYDPTNWKNKIMILKNILRDVINAFTYIHACDGFCNFTTPNCIIMCKKDNQIIFKLLTFHLLTDKHNYNSVINMNLELRSIISQSSSMKRYLDTCYIGLIGLRLYLGEKFTLADLNDPLKIVQLFKNSYLCSIYKITGDFKDFLCLCLLVSQNKPNNVQKLLEHKFFS